MTVQITLLSHVRVPIVVVPTMYSRSCQAYKLESEVAVLRQEARRRVFFSLLPVSQSSTPIHSTSTILMKLLELMINVYSYTINGRIKSK